MIWTKEEDNLLISIYPSLTINDDKKKICSLFKDRSWDALKLRAKKLNIKMNRSGHIPEGKIENLLQENPEAFYYAGFIAADGHIGNYRLSIYLSSKDDDHLKKIANFINIKNIRYFINSYGTEVVGFSIRDTTYVKQFSEKFDLKNNKTIHPPDVSWMYGWRMLSFLAGFIDGDGSIRKQTGRDDASLTIKCHASWIDNFIIFEDFFYKELNIKKFNKKRLSKINNAGYALLAITDNTILREFKNRLINLKLPLMGRKWDIIDTSLISKYEITKRNVVIVNDLKNNGYKNKDICKHTGLSKAAVHNLLKKGVIQ